MSADHAQVETWRAERSRIVGSMAYAFAMGHGCSLGPSTPEERAILRRKDDLDALISEYEGGSPST